MRASLHFWFVQFVLVDFSKMITHFILLFYFLHFIQNIPEMRESKIKRRRKTTAMLAFVAIQQRTKKNAIHHKEWQMETLNKSKLRWNIIHQNNNNASADEHEVQWECYRFVIIAQVFSLTQHKCKRNAHSQQCLAHSLCPIGSHFTPTHFE